MGARRSPQWSGVVGASFEFLTLRGWLRLVDEGIEISQCSARSRRQSHADRERLPDGYIDDIDPNAGEIFATFDGRSITYGFGDLDMLVPAYATTIHKSQGSEYPAVIIPTLTQHYAMLQRILLHTGITRGKRLVVLVGQRKAVAIAVRNISGRRRWSKLQAWLSSGPPLSR
jgi:hypothetical protein